MKDHRPLFNLNIHGKRAFEAIYDQMYSLVYYFAYRFIRSKPDAEEIANESFVKLSDSRVDLSNIKAVKGFLFIVTKNKCLNHLHRLQRTTSFQDELHVSESSIEDRMIRSELLYEIYKRIDALPQQQKAVFKMSYIEDKSTIEIAELLSLSESTVRNHKAKALQTLKQWLSADNGLGLWVLYALVDHMYVIIHAVFKIFIDE